MFWSAGSMYILILKYSPSNPGEGFFIVLDLLSAGVLYGRGGQLGGFVDALWATLCLLVEIQNFEISKSEFGLKGNRVVFML